MIIPSILTDSLEVAKEQLEVVRDLGLTRVQIDIVDGEFADDITLHPIDIVQLDTSGLQVDVHLMTNDPINDVLECSQIPGIHAVIAQIERMPDQQAFIEHVQSYGIHPGLSLDLHTPVYSIDPNVLEHVSLVQVMGNKAGTQGESFEGSHALVKIKELVALNQLFEICVDIGMTPQTIGLCTAAGAHSFAVGSYLWTSADKKSALEALRSNA